MGTKLKWRLMRPVGKRGTLLYYHTSRKGKYLHYLIDDEEVAWTNGSK